MTEPTPQGEKFERLAFQYCKIATFSLLLGRYALPAAAILSATFFVVAFVQGVRISQCYLRWPLIIAGVWAGVAAIWFVREFHMLPKFGWWG
jgi:hypothetical protein